MSQIRCIYRSQPNFPATDQHPDAVRYQVGALFVDAIGGQPTQAEVDAVLGQDVTALAAKQRLIDDANDLAAAKLDAAIQQIVNATPAQLRTFAQNSFPTLTLSEQNRLGLILNILAVAVRPHVR
jgi:protein-disulfide isomerase-like protein with CxxC motif